MEQAEADKLVKQLAVGFETLQDEYQKLFGQHQALEKKLATAKEHYNELAKLCGSGRISTPPLSFTSSPDERTEEPRTTSSVADILDQRESAKHIVNKVRFANEAAAVLHDGLPRLRDPTSEGVKIWSGPSADRPAPGSSMMPSISESPLEQDFTIEGMPSRLGCPFASMAEKRLSSHAASVLERYSQRSPVSPADGTNRFPSKESLAKNGDRRASFADPIKAEICGLSDHDMSAPYSERAMQEHLNKQENAEVGVCPIRFLDQHSPEEVATYFENHKHELPRSHEVCVKRYQSNEKQIRELDEKYGNLVSMIQGLGAKHQDYLPEEPKDAEAVTGEGKEESSKSADRVRQWASSVSAQAAHGENGENNDDRQPHFERPLRDIRVGESPSRPRGISVPPQYLEKAGSVRSSHPAQVLPTKQQIPPAPKMRPESTTKHEAKCPFDFGKHETIQQTDGVDIATDKAGSVAVEDSPRAVPSDKQARMVFNGPIIIGYSPEDAAKILREAGLGGQ